MFDSVLEKAPPQRRIGTGTIISIGVHVALLALVTVLTTRHEEVPEVKEPQVIFRPAAHPARPLGDAAVASSTSKPPSATPKPRRPNAIIPPREVPSTPPPVVAPPDDVEPGTNEGTGGPIGDRDGVRDGGDQHAPPGPGDAHGEGVGDPPVGDYVLGMTRPQIPAGAFQNLYSREALEAQVEGTMIVRCNAMADGSLLNCHVLKGLPHLEAEVLRRLATTRVTPATSAGRPTSIGYVFNFNFKIPR
jgi:protein TonB